MRPMILLIDDEAGLRRLVARILTEKGYRVAEAANGREAIAKLTNQVFTLIVLDHNMPIMDGLAFLTALRQDLKSEIPVLMMSGNSDLNVRRQCYALGVYDFINKPESTDIMMTRVENGLKIAELLEFRRHTQRELQFSAGILKNLATPTEVRGQCFLLQTLNKSFAEVGGDICLTFGAETAKPVFVIGDITGHGISAALFHVFVSVAIRRAYRETLAPNKILTRLNRELAEYLPAHYFVTMFCWCYDTKAGTLHYVNAGHPAPFVFCSGKSSQLELPQLPALGVQAHQEYESKTIPFQAGDWLMAYTDGIFDILKGQDYNLDTTVSDLALQSASGTGLFSQMQSHLQKQTDFIDDRSVMILNALEN
jgi:CheY-like chemotaxis protein